MAEWVFIGFDCIKGTGILQIVVDDHDHSFREPSLKGLDSSRHPCRGRVIFPGRRALFLSLKPDFDQPSKTQAGDSLGTNDAVSLSGPNLLVGKIENRGPACVWNF